MKTWWPSSKVFSKVNVIQQKFQGLVLIWGPKSLESFISVKLWQLQQDALDLCWNKWKINHISSLSPEQRRSKPSWKSQFTIFWIRKVLGVSKAMPCQTLAQHYKRENIPTLQTRCYSRLSFPLKHNSHCYCRVTCVCGCWCTEIFQERN